MLKVTMAADALRAISMAARQQLRDLEELVADVAAQSRVQLTEVRLVIWPIERLAHLKLWHPLRLKGWHSNVEARAI